MNLKLFINKFKRVSLKKSSILFSRATFWLIILTFNIIPLLSHASVANCRDLFTQPNLSSAGSSFNHLTSSKTQTFNFSNFNKNLGSLLLTKLLSPDGLLYKNSDNSIKEAFSIEFDHHNHQFRLISLKTPSNYQLINTLKELNLIISLDHIYVNSQSSKFIEQILDEAINNGKVVHIENNQHSRLIFSPTNLQKNYISNQNNNAKNELLLESIEILQQSLKTQISKSSEFHLVITLLNSALSLLNRAQTFSSNDITDFFPKSDLIKLILSSPQGPEILDTNQITVNNLERFSSIQLIELLQHINNYELEANAKIRRNILFQIKSFYQMNTGQFEKIKIANLNLNFFILEQFHENLKKMNSYAANIKSKSPSQIKKIKELIRSADSEILVLHEIHTESIKQFIKDNFDDLYELHTFDKHNKPFKQQFSTAVLIKKSLPIQIKVITHEQFNGTNLTHPIFEYHFFSKNESPSTSKPKAIIIAGQLKSLKNNGKSVNEVELTLLGSLLESINKKFSDIPILAAIDLNNNVKLKEVRDTAFGKQFNDVRAQNNTNFTATHFTVDPRQVDNVPIKHNEIDVLYGNQKAQELKLSETLPDELAFLGFLDKNGKLKVPRTIEERESLDFISDHLIIFTFLNPQFLGLQPRVR